MSGLTRTEPRRGVPDADVGVPDENTSSESLRAICTGDDGGSESCVASVTETPVTAL